MSPLTLDEIVSTIKKSTNPNLIIEGKDDMKVYRKLKKLISSDIQLIVCNGRETVLKVYNRKDEFTDKNVIFIADKDMFVFDGKHAHYPDIVWTKGYSIEK